MIGQTDRESICIWVSVKQEKQEKQEKQAILTGGEFWVFKQPLRAIQQPLPIPARLSTIPHHHGCSGDFLRSFQGMLYSSCSFMTIVSDAGIS